MRRRVLYVLALVLLLGRRSRCEEDNSKWYSGIRSLLADCPVTPWNSSLHEDVLETFRNCIQRRALAALDSLLLDDVIPVVEGINLLRFQRDESNETSYELEKNDTYGPELNTSWSEIALTRLTGVLKTHVLKIDVDQFCKVYGAQANGTTSEKVHTQARRRRHKRRHQMMPLMMMGLLLMGSVLIPMGFQFLAVLGGKALLLAKMALIMSSIQGLKKIATSGVNYGLYHAPQPLPSLPEAWHERSHREPPNHHFDDLPYHGHHHP